MFSDLPDAFKFLEHKAKYRYFRWNRIPLEELLLEYVEMSWIIIVRPHANYPDITHRDFVILYFHSRLHLALIARGWHGAFLGTFRFIGLYKKVLYNTM